MNTNNRNLTAAKAPKTTRFATAQQPQESLGEDQATRVSEILYNMHSSFNDADALEQGSTLTNSAGSIMEQVIRLKTGFMKEIANECLNGVLPFFTKEYQFESYISVFEDTNAIIDMHWIEVNAVEFWGLILDEVRMKHITAINDKGEKLKILYAVHPNNFIYRSINGRYAKLVLSFQVN